MDIGERSLNEHKKWRGKLEIKSRVKASNREELSLCYTPGVARPCMEIKKDYEKSFLLTRRHNTVAVISDGTAVLGLGDIGPEASMPVMEGKCVLFKEFADVDAIPLCVRSKDVDEIVRTVYLLSGSFGGINLEDIAAPRCFEIERRLKEICDIPVFHDDQHGTAVVVAAALINALKLAKKRIEDIKLVVNGAGSAGVAISNHLLNMGLKNLVLVDKQGILNVDDEEINDMQRGILRRVNVKRDKGTLKEAMKEADVFIGVSAPNIVTKEMVKSMNKDAVVFAMANPNPEILPEEAKEAGALVVGTGRSDYKNQINNVLAFPGIFRGALDVRATDITEEMKVAASKALAELVSEEELSVDYILPDAFDKRVSKQVAKAVSKKAIESHVSALS